MSYDRACVVITGASRGIGRDISLAFARETERPLLLLSRSQKRLLETKKLCKKIGNNRVIVKACDLTREGELKNIRFPEGFPVPGILINNAGSYLLKSLSETSYEEFSGQVQSNLFSAVHTTNRFVRGFKSLDRSLIINICSTGALMGLKESGAYAASKHALLGYSRSLRKELMHTGVGVTAINLGQTESGSWDESDMNPQRLIDPKDVARLIVMLTRFSPRTLAEEIVLTPQHGRVPSM